MATHTHALLQRIARLEEQIKALSQENVALKLANTAFAARAGFDLNRCVPVGGKKPEGICAGS